MDERNGMTYPKRGEMSEDGKFYTHTDGTVNSFDTSTGFCNECVFVGVNCSKEVPAKCQGGVFKRIEGAYVPSTEEQEACDMARAMIVNCGDYRYWSKPPDVRTSDHDKHHCVGCVELTERKCPARAYLAAHGDAHAWETNG